MPHIRVSVVICTHNRAAVLPGALDALLGQDGAVPHEIILVNNNSTDATEEVVRERLARAPQPPLRLRAAAGLPFARNAGIRAAEGAIVAFTDDDVRVGPNWVATIARLFEANPDVDAVGGRVMPIWPARFPEWVTRRQLGPFALGERGDEPLRIGAHNAAPCLVGANFAFRREVFDRIGPFDPAYTKSQDREIQLRLWRAGGVGLYAPEMAISVEIPAERLTKKYFREWYTTYGVYRSRMRLLDTIDRNGRLVDPAGRQIRGVPAFLYRSLADSIAGWIRGAARLDTTAAFYWENRVRYIFSAASVNVTGNEAGRAARGWNAHENASRRDRSGRR